MNVRGTAEVLRNLNSVIVEINNAIIDSVEIAALDIERSAKIYETPYVDTGRLRLSITASKKTDLTYEVGTKTVEYAAEQEFGSSRTRAQPYLRPALEDAKIKYPNLIRGEVRRI